MNKLIARITSEDLQELWDIEVRILDKHTQKPIGGEGYIIEFYDEDSHDEDFLVSGPLNENGIADVRFNPAAIHAGEEDSIMPETNPDIFFIIKKDGKQVYRSATIYDVDFDQKSTFDIVDGKEIYLGTFLIELNNV